MRRVRWGLVAVDLVVAAAAGFLTLSLFAVAGQEDTRPPVCSNRFGATIDCAQDDWAGILAWVVFGVVLLGLWAYQRRRSRAA